MGKVQINGFEMSYQLRGEGEPLFLLHGMNGAGANWNMFPKAFDGFQAIIPDFRGHGRSDNPSGQFSIRQCASDVIALADALQIDHFKSIGLSLGGNTMLHVASKAQNRVDAMVIVSATPYFSEQARAVMTEILRQEPGAAEVEQMLSLHIDGKTQIEALRRYAKEMSESHDDMDFTSSTLAQITAKTLIVHGDSDPLYPIEMPLMLHESIPNSSLWVIPEGGHVPVFQEHAETFVETSIRFLNSG